MALLPDDPAERAAIFTALAGMAAVAWKSLFGAKRDLRDDRSSQKQHDGFGTLVNELQEEVDRLAKMVRDLSTRLDNEISRRREVETENHELRQRLAHLELVAKAQGWTI